MPRSCLRVVHIAEKAQLFSLILPGTRNSFCELAAAALAGLFVMFHLFKPLHQPFLIALFLEPAECLFKGLV